MFRKMLFLFFFMLTLSAMIPTGETMAQSVTKEPGKGFVCDSPRNSEPYFEELQTYLKNKIPSSSKLTKIFPSLPSSIRQEFARRFPKANPEELRFLSDILNVGASMETHLDDVLRGAHVRIRDNGFLYDQWSQFSRARACLSSHPHVGKQYGVSGELFGQILFGQVEDSQGNILTWFQLEKSASQGYNPLQILSHGCDYIQYRVTGRNIGPYGDSQYVDKSPLIFD